MDSTETKMYNKHGFNSKEYLETYFSEKSSPVFGDELLKFPMEKIHQACVSGDIKGDILIDISVGPIVHHLYPMCGLFKDILLFRFNERCIIELRKWRNAHDGAFDWTHISPTMAELLRDSKQWELKDALLKSKIKQVVKCDIEKENLTDPLQLPQADSVTSAWTLDNISSDKEEYIKNLRKIANLLKPGGRLLLVGALEGTYYMVGKKRMHLLKYDENFVKDALAKEGLTVTHSEVLPSKAVSDLTDYKGKVFVAARKDK
ncbi:indolethylamine N-methyltransferase-like [Hyperolius riggenbachi]|uniref:indolethylamine N-methyltransferase-like n=1 Tax=Hyperolius riggenbachi TaxID=752182 RepID=UPI0035A32632